MIKCLEIWKGRGWLLGRKALARLHGERVMEVASGVGQAGAEFGRLDIKETNPVVAEFVVQEKR